MKRHQSLLALSFVALLVVLWGYLGPRFDPPRWKPTPMPERPAAGVQHDPQNFPLGRYWFKTPEGTIGGGPNRLGGGNFHIVMGSGPVHWFGRDDLGQMSVGSLNLQTSVGAITGVGWGSGPPKLPNDSVIVIQENAVAFHADSALYVLPNGLRDARGDPVEILCWYGADQFERFALSKTVSALETTNCQLTFRPRIDVYVKLQGVPSARLVEFLEHVEKIYSLVSDSIKDEP